MCSTRPPASCGWEHFFDWKRVAEEGEAGRVSLEHALRGLLEPARLLDYIENFIVFQDMKGGVAKIAAKNHQLLGVNKSIARLVFTTTTRALPADPTEASLETMLGPRRRSEASYAVSSFCSSPD